MRTRILALAASILVLTSTPARAQLPTTVAPDLFAFPGGHLTPGSAASAGRALADRWLGEDVFDNPAASRPYTLGISPMVLHVSRQDLRADHRSYEETSAFFDAAGGYFAMERGAIGLTLYGHQPLVRIEENSFLSGSFTAPSGSVTSNTDARELRGGLAVSFGTGVARFGIAGEWTHRADHYESVRVTGAPAPDSYVADFSGEAVGGQAGFRLKLGEGGRGVVLGGGVRYLPELELTGDQTLSGSAGTATNPLTTRREAGWEGGISTRCEITEAFHALAGAGGKTTQDFEGWGVTSGTAFEWKIAGEYHDARDPWTVRFGGGQEQQNGVPEPRSAVVGLGFGFQFETTVIDLGVVHRSFKRGDHPASAEDRVLISVVQRF